jgi:hypothetical protein
VAGGCAFPALDPLSVGFLLVGGFIFLFSLLVLGCFVGFSLWGWGGQWGAGIFLAVAENFLGVYTPHPCPISPANPILLSVPI